MAIKDRLKSQRTRQNMTLEEVARMVGVTRATVQKYENGIIANIPSDKIEALAKALDTTPAYLMGWEEENESSPGLLPLPSGEAAPDPKEARLTDLYRQLNTDGQEKLIDYADDLVSSGKYIKSDPSGLGQKQA